MNISEDAMYYTIGATSITPPEKLKLNKLDFATGIRASEINENFDLVKYWIDAERLRIGGWGLVEGFDLERIESSFSIHVGAGIIINEHGEEVHVPEAVLHAGPPVRHPMVERNKIIDDNGELELEFALYSDVLQHTIKYRIPDMMEEIENTDLQITVADTGQQIGLHNIESILENKLIIPGYKNTEVNVNYWYANDRIDGIFLKKDGSEYQYEIGIISTNPSEQVIQDYFNNGYYLIGFAYWHVGHTVEVEFITGDRTLRRVFVDRNNILYLNGKPYKEKTVIYFIEPEYPEENTLWYNVEEEVLYIWRPDENGVYGWQVVNDLSRTLVSVHQFTLGENPDDLQTFLFRDYPELSFIPKRHQLTIIIDQVVLMEDQYEELFPEDGEGFASGYGIRLKYPLERPSVVEVRVTRNIHSNRKQEDLFPHEAFYGASGNFTITNASNTIFNAGCQFQPFQSQIEVYKNGLRLIEGVHFVGLLTNGTVAEIGHTDCVCDKFKMLISIRTGDEISFRILRPVASFSNLKSIFQAYEDKVNACLDLANSVDTLTNAVATMKTDHETAIATNRANITALQNEKMNANAKLTKTNLDETIYRGIVKQKFSRTEITSGNPITIPGICSNDFFVVGYASSNANYVTMLSEGFDYTTEDNEEGGLDIILEARWLADATAKLYINGIKIGV